MFVMGMIVGAVVAVLLAFVAAVALVLRSGTSVRCDTCGVHSPSQPLVMERHAGGVRVKRPTPPPGWRNLPNGDHECASCANAQLMRSIGGEAPATPGGAA